MEFALATVTILSLLMTLTMGVVTWRLVHEERRRSAARLAALAAELRDSGRAERARAYAPAAPGAATVEPRAVATPQPPYTSVDAPPHPATVDAIVDAPLRPSGAPSQAAAGCLFGAPVESTSTLGNRFAALGAAAALVVGVISVALFAFSGRAPEPASTQQARPPVELLVLDHDTQGSFLAINGSVRNPAGAAPADQLAVMAMAFDETGAMVARGRAPVELLSLPPGAASSFAVQVPAAGVSRYRITFLIDDTTVPHVDRRATAQPEGPTREVS